MKKFFAFAIAAVTMTVGCQKIQDLVNPNASVDDTDLVEIKFSSNIATVETKSAVTELTTVNVYGINGTTAQAQLKDTRYFINTPATATNDAGTYKLTLDKTYFYHGKTDKYSFYGYFLDAAVAGTGLDAEPYQATVTITGEEDILLASAAGNGTYCGEEAETNGLQPSLEFNHALSQFQFEAQNMGKAAIKLEAISIATPQTGTMDVLASTVTAGTDEGTIDVGMTALELGAENGAFEVVKDAANANGALAMVMPNATYKITFTVSQGTETRTLTQPVVTTINAGTAYKFQIKLYSLTAIELTATLTPWGSAQEVEFDTSNAIENN